MAINDDDQLQIPDKASGVIQFSWETESIPLLLAVDTENDPVSLLTACGM
jgi:hypothetical protein